MNEPLDERYLTWLYSRVGSVKVSDPARTYWSLFRQLYVKEFLWLIPNDDNRVEDGRDLRVEFLKQSRIRNVDQDWLHLGCSVLELLIGVARRLSFEADGDPRVWFFHLLDNLGLGDLTDENYNHTEYVEDVLDNFIWRTYDRSGRGGLFPLQDPTDDQKDVEIWYQLCAYILERG